MADPDRRHQTAERYLGHRAKAQAAITEAVRSLQAAHLGIASFNPSVLLLETARADVEMALEEARGMANMDDATVKRRKPAA
jgi:hypothetical protein